MSNDAQGAVENASLTELARRHATTWGDHSPSSVSMLAAFGKALLASQPSPAATVESVAENAMQRWYADPRVKEALHWKPHEGCSAANADEVAKIIDPDCVRALVTEREWCERWGKDFQKFAAGYIARWDVAVAKANAILALNEPQTAPEFDPERLQSGGAA